MYSTLDGDFIDEPLSKEFIDLIQNNYLMFNNLMTYYRCAMMQMETKLKVLNEHFSLKYDRNPIETIKTRLKSGESIAKKLQRQNLPSTIESIEQNLNDIAGIRVICSFPEDIYLITDCLMNQDDLRLIEMKDYIKNPKANGYRSLHLIMELPIFLDDKKKFMRTEIQLRTIAMDFWASLEHKLRYKKNISAEESEYLHKELLECAEISTQLDTRMQKIRSRIMP